MIVEQIHLDIEYRKFNHLIACPESRNAVVVDPLDSDLCLKVAGRNGWNLTHVINTHEHFDHIDGNAVITAATGALLLAHSSLTDTIPNVDKALEHGDSLQIGPSGSIEILYTPGYTLGHICLWVRGNHEALITADTLFNAGIGHCKYGADLDTLYETINSIFSQLPDELTIYPGHDYLENNLKFTLDREPGNATARSLLSKLPNPDAGERFVCNLGLERKINVFLRLNSQELFTGLGMTFPKLPEEPGDETVFMKLRELRDAW